MAAARQEHQPKPWQADQAQEMSPSREHFLLIHEISSAKRSRRIDSSAAYCTRREVPLWGCDEVAAAGTSPKSTSRSTVFNQPRVRGLGGRLGRADSSINERDRPAASFSCPVFQLPNLPTYQPTSSSPDDASSSASSWASALVWAWVVEQAPALMSRPEPAAAPAQNRSNPPSRPKPRRAASRG